MTQVFETDFRAEIAEAFAGQLPPLVLIKTVQTDPPADDPLAAPTITEVRHNCIGYFETVERVNPQTLVAHEVNIITLIGGSLPEAVDAETGDQLEIDGACWKITRVFADATRASYECHVDRVAG